MKLTLRSLSLLFLLLWQLPLLAATYTLKAKGGLYHATAATRNTGRPLTAPRMTPVALTQTAPAAAARPVTPAFLISPNPSHGLVTISVASLTAGYDYKLRLSNIIGREVRTVALRPDTSDRGMNLNLSDLPSGMYFYSLLQNDRVVSTKRLLLQN
ncbi:T9SS type A sorting domain-containing protein [Hymenobacter sp. NST-14]|uniref:T9SS type A sorting domain-containing protein n=1 Tax=Hymenobacter piscis TaxID=2839984 RepID=UPI001C02E339|nr:T9SS type A sorting domain-containing protein [Hymenobacter piscis]MBT9391814.1 T9SS type A sorting domain-containing protein [Hymenobacter piscis]